MSYLFPTSKGRLLAKGPTSSDQDGANAVREIEIRRIIESDLRAKVETIVGQIVGPESVIATVTCELDFNQIDRVSETYDKRRKVLTHETSFLRVLRGERKVQFQLIHPPNIPRWSPSTLFQK